MEYDLNELASALPMESWRYLSMTFFTYPVFPFANVCRYLSMSFSTLSLLLSFNICALPMNMIWMMRVSDQYLKYVWLIL
jgi:hypothetical protein